MKTRDTVGASGAHSNERDGKNKCSSQEPTIRTGRRRRRNKEGLLYNGCGQREKLL